MSTERNWWKCKVCLVTGGGRGIGAAIARQAAGKGAAVAVNYLHSQDSAGKLVDDIVRKGGRAIAVRADVSKADQVEYLFTTVERELGAVSLLVNNAGLARQSLLIDTSEEDWDEIQTVNLKGPYLTCKRALPSMMDERFGRIVNIASVWGLRAASTETAYAASKGGLIALSRSLAAEVGPWGVTVNAVAPGAIATDMLMGPFQPGEMAALVQETPAGRVGKADDVASACIYLLSEAAAFITGSVLVIDGGWKA